VAPEFYQVTHDTMNSKERFQAAISHKESDRVPVDYLATAAVTENLKKYFGITTERELLDTINSDFYYLTFRDISQNEAVLPFYKGPKLYFTKKERICPLGVRFHRKVFNDKLVPTKQYPALSKTSVLPGKSLIIPGRNRTGLTWNLS